jgi:RecA/RadA recombinase
MRDQALYEASKELLLEMGYFNNYPFANIIFNYMNMYYERTHKLPNLSSYTLDMPAWFTYYELSEADTLYYTDFIRYAFNAPVTEINNDDVITIIKSDYVSFISNSFKTELTGAEDLEVDDIYERAKKYVLKYENDPFTRAKVEPIFAQDFEEMLAAAMRKSIGVKFIDEMLDGGVAPGELIGILAPSGGGKSTIGCMILAACVATSRNCWYYSTEQKLKGDLFIRFCCLATGLQRKVFSAGWKAVPADTKELLTKAKPRYLKYSKFADVSTTKYQSLDGLFEEVHKDIANNEPPGCIVIDWWGRLSDQLNINNPSIKSDPQARRHDRDNLHKLKQFAEEFNCPIIVLHQLSGVANEKGPKAKLTGAHAQENKTFPNMFDFCFIIGNRDSDNIATVHTDKARSTAKTTRKQKLNGAFCRFEDPDNFDSDVNSYHADITNIMSGQRKLDLGGL